ncbi:tripartite tricarboxylate transporter substrate binding protein [Sporomusa silvacetica]|nr:tripartite tricarboxylate transporter substrate binding protein [Sporomusa silvacetica]
MSLIIGGCTNKSDKLVSTSQEYPTRPISIIVPSTVGGSVDLLARALATSAVNYISQPLVVTNIPGGAATIGWNELARAKADGYTIGIVTTGLILQPLYGSTRYHYSTALEPLVQVVSLPIAAVVRSDQPWQNLNDLIHHAKEHPGEIKFGHPGLGSPRHVVGEMFAMEAGIDIKQVPFSGESEELAALLGGHIQLIFVNTSIIKDHIKSGTLRVLAVATEQHLNDDMFKDVLTFKEQGVDVVSSLWYGIGVPKGLPQTEKDKLVEGLNGIIHDPEFIKKIEALGMPIEYLGPQDFSQKWLADNSRLTKIVKNTGIAERIAAQKN